MSIKKEIRQIPLIKKIIRIKLMISAIRANNLFYPPGHYYSPIPSIKEIDKYKKDIFGDPPIIIEGINLREEQQLELLNKFVKYYGELPNYQPEKQSELRYYFHNSEYKYSDAILLYCMMRHLKPQRIIEIGSGYSSCLMLDTNKLFFNSTIDIQCIDPNPQRLLSHINESDKETIRIHKNPLQDVPVVEFQTLQENDILFIDSTHVCKTHSDVNRILFEILPCLSSGVYIHFHDIFYPFEYPKKWIYEGRAWNEAYFLRAFLQYNNAFEVVLMNTYMEYFHEDFFKQHLALCLKERGGSIWIKKM